MFRLYKRHGEGGGGGVILGYYVILIILMDFWLVWMFWEYFRYFDDSRSIFIILMVLELRVHLVEGVEK